jgi:hypothetical protein
MDGAAPRIATHISDESVNFPPYETRYASAFP